MGWGDFWGHGTTSVANFSSRLRRMRVSPSGALPQKQNFSAPSAHASVTFWSTTSGAKFLRAFGACECHFLEHTSGAIFPPRLRRKRVSPPRMLPKKWPIIVLVIIHIFTCAKGAKESLPTGLLRRRGDYHLVVQLPPKSH